MILAEMTSAVEGMVVIVAFLLVVGVVLRMRGYRARGRFQGHTGGNSGDGDGGLGWHSHSHDHGQHHGGGDHHGGGFDGGGHDGGGHDGGGGH
jgi:hypothetical protein